MWLYTGGTTKICTLWRCPIPLITSAAINWPSLYAFRRISSVWQETVYALSYIVRAYVQFVIHLRADIYDLTHFFVVVPLPSMDTVPKFVVPILFPHLVVDEQQFNGVRVVCLYVFYTPLGVF